jgi:hypothetical protein
MSENKIFLGLILIKVLNPSTLDQWNADQPDETNQVGIPLRQGDQTLDLSQVSISTIFYEKLF